jgi:oligopeptide/dipeptide ABC transporter ATP-binding protein
MNNAITHEPVLLEVRDLTVRYGRDAEHAAVRDVSFNLKPGEALGIVGESGSGKGSIAGAILNLLDPSARIDGQILFEGRDLMRLSRKARRAVLGREPVSALDVSVQAAIVNLLADLRDQFGLAYLFISHDLAVVAQLSDRVAVMYHGRICETGTPAELLASPRHPYTRMLLAAVTEEAIPEERPAGDQIAISALGCAFAARCPHCLPSLCETAPPLLRTITASHEAACHLELVSETRRKIVRSSPDLQQRRNSREPHRSNLRCSCSMWKPLCAGDSRFAAPPQGRTRVPTRTLDHRSAVRRQACWMA